MIIRELLAKFGFEIDNQALKTFDAAVSTAHKSVENLGNRIDRTGRSIQRAGSRLSLFLTAPLTLAAGVMINAASDAEETAQRFNVVYKDILDGANSIAKSFGRDFGIARDKTKELLGTTGDLLTGFGFTQDQALDLANQVARLGGDLASFNNIQGGTEEAVTRLTKGILGETENLKLLGVVVNQTTKEFRDEVAQLQATRGLTLQQAKAQTILNMSIRQSKNAIGDFARTNKGFANQLRIFRSRVRDVAVEFGKILLPVANRVLGVFIKIAETIDDLPRPMKTIILAIGSFIGIVGPLLFILGSLVANFGFLLIKLVAIKNILAFFGITRLGAIVKLFGGLLSILSRFSASGIAFRLITTALLGLSVAALKVIAVLAAIGFAIFLLVDDFNVWLQNGDSVIGKLIGNFETLKQRVMIVLRAIGNIFSAFWGAIVNGTEEDWNKLINAIIASFPVFLKALKVIGKGIFLFIHNLITGLAKVIAGIIIFIANRIATLIKTLLNRFGDNIVRGFGKIGNFLGFGSGESEGKTNVSPSSVAQGLSSSTSNTRTTNQNIETNVKVEVPPGTKEQQVNFLEDAAKKIFDNRFNNQLASALSASPRGEQ